MKKVLYVLLAVVLAGGIFCYTSWNRWFHNPPEAVYTTPDFPDRITWTLAEGTHDRVLSWRCGEAVDSAFVDFVCQGRADTLRVPAVGTVVDSRSGKSAFYQAHFSGLQEGAVYAYRIATSLQQTSWHSFRVVPSGNFSFVLFGDIHVPDSLLLSMVTVLDTCPASKDAAFWAFAGDMIERPTDVYWCAFYDALGDVPLRRPVLACTGNHEYLKALVKPLDTRWVHTFVNPANGPEKYLGRTYYVDYEPVRMVVLDTDGLAGPADYVRVRKWLKQVLSDNPQKWTMVIMHHPVYSAAEGRSNPLMRMAFNGIFVRYGVDVVIQGHDHSYMRRNSYLDGRVTTPVYMVLNSSPKNYRQKSHPVADCTGYGERFYQHVTVSADSLCVRTYRAAGNTLYDGFVVRK